MNRDLRSGILLSKSRISSYLIMCNAHYQAVRHSMVKGCHKFGSEDPRDLEHLCDVCFSYKYRIKDLFKINPHKKNQVKCYFGRANNRTFVSSVITGNVIIPM